MTSDSDVPDPVPIPIIYGPTASGKTAVAVRLAGMYPIEVISADSRQIIRRLDIGTAKPTAEQRRKVQFHLVDLVEPGERYTAFQFIEDAERAIDDILRRSRIPLIVGGTGLYLRALTEGVVEIEGDDLGVRQRLEEEMREQGPEAMYRRLCRIDPAEAAGLHANNRVRVMRALEIYYLTGKTKSELMRTGNSRKSRHTFTYFCLLPDRQKLYRAIEERVDRMLAQGLLEEVEYLCREGLAESIKKVNTIGYKELLDHVNGRRTLAEAASLIKQNTRRYAKRQITWARHQINSARIFSDSQELVGAVRNLLDVWMAAMEKS